MKQAKVIINDLITALKRLPVLWEDIRLKIVLPTLEKSAKKANKIHIIFIPRNQKLPYFPRIFQICLSTHDVARNYRKLSGNPYPF